MKHTYVAGNVCVSTGSKDWDGITLNFKLLSFRFLPFILITTLEGQNTTFYKTEQLITLESDYIVEIDKELLTSLKLKALTRDWMKNG